MDNKKKGNPTDGNMNQQAQNNGMNQQAQNNKNQAQNNNNPSNGKKDKKGDPTSNAQNRIF